MTVKFLSNYAFMKSSTTPATQGGMIIQHAKFSRINSGQAIPTFGAGQVMTVEKK